VTSSPCDGVKMPRIERMQMRFLITSGGARWPYVYQPPLDRYGHLFLGSEEVLNGSRCPCTTGPRSRCIGQSCAIVREGAGRRSRIRLRM
jgi:hypothetical protein